MLAVSSESTCYVGEWLEAEEQVEGYGRQAHQFLCRKKKRKENWKNSKGKRNVIEGLKFKGKEMSKRDKENSKQKSSETRKKRNKRGLKPNKPKLMKENV